MLQFSTSGYLVLHAMALENMDNADSVPASLPDTIEGKRKWLRALSTQIVETVWFGPNADDLRALDLMVSQPVGRLEDNSTLDSLGVYGWCCGTGKLWLFNKSTLCVQNTD